MTPFTIPSFLLLSDKLIVSIPQQSRGLYDCWSLKGGLIAIVQNQNREPFIVQPVAKVLIIVIPAKAGIQFFSGSRVAPGSSPGLPGMTILDSRNCQPRTRYGAPGRAEGLSINVN